MGIGKRRKRDDVLAADIGRRIKELIGDRKRSEIAPRIGVASSTLWDYMNGDAIPGPEVLIKIGEVLGVSIDYLLKGNQSLFAKNEMERDTLYVIREAQELGGAGIAEKIPQYGRFILKDVKKPKEESDRKSKPSRHKAGGR